MVDGDLKRTLNYSDAVDGYNFPQTPMQLKLGIWDGGASTEAEGTIEWAGGETDYSDAPFTMYVESVNITNYYPAETYTYSDTSGAYTSIVMSNSTGSNATVSTSGTTSSNSSTTTTSTSGSSNSSSSSGTSTSSSASASSSAPASGAVSSFAISPVAVLTAVAFYFFL